MKRLALTLVLCTGVTQANGSSLTAAQANPSLSGQPDQALQITPFVWAASLHGHVSPFRRGPAVDVGKSFSEVMDGINVGGFLHLWSRQDRRVFSGEIMYVDSSDSHASGPLAAFQIPELGVVLPPGADVNARVDSRQFMASLLGGYRVVESPQYTLDLLAGVRLWHISNEITVSASHPSIGSQKASHGENFVWADPLAGLRLFIPLTEAFSLQTQADIGGLGVGSDYTWSVFAVASYTLTEDLSVSAGYKALKVDYDRRGHLYDVLLSGPVAGVTWRF